MDWVSQMKEIIQLDLKRNSHNCNKKYFMMDWVLKWKKLFNWIWIEILVIEIFKKKFKQNFLCLWTIKRHFLFNMQSNNIYLTKWWVPHNFFVDTNTSWIYLAICFYTKPWGRNDSFSLPYRRRRRRREREREKGGHDTIDIII
jgi:hypothetical protein